MARGARCQREYRRDFGRCHWRGRGDGRGYIHGTGAAPIVRVFVRRGRPHLQDFAAGGSRDVGKPLLARWVVLWKGDDLAASASRELPIARAAGDEHGEAGGRGAMPAHRIEGGEGVPLAFKKQRLCRGRRVADDERVAARAFWGVEPAARFRADMGRHKRAVRAMDREGGAILANPDEPLRLQPGDELRGQPAPGREAGRMIRRKLCDGRRPVGRRGVRHLGLALASGGGQRCGFNAGQREIAGDGRGGREPFQLFEKRNLIALFLAAAGAVTPTPDIAALEYGKAVGFLAAAFGKGRWHIAFAAGRRRKAQGARQLGER